MKQYKVGQFAKLVNVTVKTLQNWDKQGTLKAYRTPTNQRFYELLLIKDFIPRNN